ncbi:MAG: lipase maturation factor family protein [Verrucomicrobia bacterium]|nr:MAG: lipase maturation factor family protein [Verrucomicrobiota bacterium]
MDSHRGHAAVAAPDSLSPPGRKGSSRPVNPPITNPARLLPPPRVPSPPEGRTAVVSLTKRQYYVSRDLFVRAVGLVFVIAFVSTLGQLPAILNPGGLWPDALWYVSQGESSAGFLWLAPEFVVAWMGPDPTAVAMLCAFGAVMGLWTVLAIAPRWSLLLATFSYAVVVRVGGEFFEFQWDSLLLECGLLGWLLAPRGASPGGPRKSPAPSSWLPVALGRLLLARVLLGSALSKLTVGAASWASLTGLLHHFETQPVPTRLGWWLAQCPPVLLQAGAALVLAIELAGGLCAVGPRKARLLAAPVLIVWFLFLDLTGGHAFMNLLTAALALLLVDDQAWARWSRKTWRPRITEPPPASRQLLQPPLAAAWALWMVFSLGVQILPTVAPRLLQSRDLSEAPVLPSYAMYPVVDERRYELVIEGSLDGRHWVAYEFRLKPGSVHRPPPWWAPFHPRLDYQLWFAAHNPEPGELFWVERLLEALLRNDPAVVRLLDHNPFGLWPPRWVRATLYEYHFTTPEERRRTGNWWWRRRVGPYAEPRQLEPDKRPDRPDPKTLHA